MIAGCGDGEAREGISGSRRGARSSGRLASFTRTIGNCWRISRANARESNARCLAKMLGRANGKDCKRKRTRSTKTSRKCGKECSLTLRSDLSRSQGLQDVYKTIAATSTAPSTTQQIALRCSPANQYPTAALKQRIALVHPLAIAAGLLNISSILFIRSPRRSVP